jgi:predicted O-methyltransferase YrrM
MCNFAAKMRLSTLIYRVLYYLRHVLTAWNTTGESIHSPYLFYIVHFLMRDKSSYYCFADIERRRDSLLLDDRMLDVVDYGSNGTQDGLRIQRRICDIARFQLERPRVQETLFRLIVHMGRVLGRPLEILELGTSLGITTAYMASAHSHNHVMTFEGSSAIADVARSQWSALRLVNIECIEGRIEDTLYKYARERIDVAYVDANHTYKATMEYVCYLLPRITEKGVVVIDDIHYSPEMKRAWDELKQHAYVTTSMDLYHVGLLYVDKHYLKRHYRIYI